MLFNSYGFVFFFLPVVLLVLFGVARGRKYGMPWLVLASLFFYGWWDVRYVPLLLVSIGFNYLVGKRLECLASTGGRQDDCDSGQDAPFAARKRKAWLVAGIVGNLLLLGYFKYTDFFLGVVNDAAGRMVFDLPRIVLPLGISFYTFTQTAYLVDAYRGLARNPSFVAYLEFVTIFPHLIAGPIINHKDMMPQFLDEANYHVRWDNMAKGITLFMMGLFKKVVIADNLAPWANDAFARPDALSFLEAWAGAFAYTVQLYFDFSGYSEMAIGLGLLLNLRLPMNFDSPYRATSIIDFWRRWHMTLGLWVKNYLYIPMGGNRHGTWRKMRNLFVSMVIIGFWHGAGWTFIAWGALHGVMLVVNHAWRTLQIKLPKFLCWWMTFVGVLACWVVFRAATLHDAMTMLCAMTDIYHTVLPIHRAETLGWLQMFGAQFAPMSDHLPVLKALAVCSCLLVCTLIFKNPVRCMESFHTSWKWFTLVCLLGVIALYQMDHYTEFLYFQF